MVINITKHLALLTVTLTGLLVAAPHAHALPEPEVEIEINNTAQTDDDVVPLNGTTTWDGPTYCRIRMKSAWDQDMTVMLVNPKAGVGELNYNRLSFYTSPYIGALHLRLPQDASWVTFIISGIRPSQSVGDAIIEARKDREDGPLKTTAHASVYWLSPVNMIVSPTKDNYHVDLTTSRIYNVSLNRAVELTAKAWLQPPGLPCSSQISNLEAGIVQNVLNYAGVALYSNPVWDTPLQGDSVEVQSQYQISQTLHKQADDFPPGDQGPVYAPMVSLCGNVATSTATDAPAFTVRTPGTRKPRPTVTVDATTKNGVTTTVTYTISSVNLDFNFLDWCALHNVAASAANPGDLQGAYQALTESGWTLNVGGTGQGDEKDQVAKRTSVQNQSPSTPMVLAVGESNSARSLSVPSEGQTGPFITLTAPN